MRRTYGACVKKEDIDSLVSDLTTRARPRLPMIIIPEGVVPLEQMPPRANYIVLHSYAQFVTSTSDLTQESIREDTNYLQITVVHEKAFVNPQYAKCFVRTAKVTSWMTKSNINSKRVVIGTTTLTEEDV